MSSSSKYDLVRIQNLIATLKSLFANSGPNWMYEVEIRAHFVTPLLKELGWDAAYMKMEWRNADIVLLTSPFAFHKSNKETNAVNEVNVHTIIELKTMHVLDLTQAHEQCLSYGKQGKFSHAKRFVTTNGQEWIFQDRSGIISGYDIFSSSFDIHSFVEELSFQKVESNLIAA